jgi:hypothetical protein
MSGFGTILRNYETAYHLNEEQEVSVEDIVNQKYARDAVIDFVNNQAREIERLKSLGRETLQKNCDTITQLAEKHRDEMTKMLEETEKLKKENEELKREVLLLQEAGYYCRTRPAPNAEINTDDAAFDHYWSVQDKDLTLWKVPRHLADVASAQTSYHGAVEQAFYDECFGEEYGKLMWMRVREMTQEDLIKGGWEPETNEDDGLCGCAKCEECPSHINPYAWAEAIHGAEEE